MSISAVPSQRDWPWPPTGGRLRAVIGQLPPATPCTTTAEDPAAMRSPASIPFQQNQAARIVERTLLRHNWRDCCWCSPSPVVTVKPTVSTCIPAAPGSQCVESSGRARTVARSPTDTLIPAYPSVCAVLKREGVGRGGAAAVGLPASPQQGDQTPRSLVSAAKRHTMLSQCGLSSRRMPLGVRPDTPRPCSSNSVRAALGDRVSSEGGNRRDAAAAM